MSIKIVRRYITEQIISVRGVTGGTLRLHLASTSVTHPDRIGTLHPRATYLSTAVECRTNPIDFDVMCRAYDVTYECEDTFLLIISCSDARYYHEEFDNYVCYRVDSTATFSNGEHPEPRISDNWCSSRCCAEALARAKQMHDTGIVHTMRYGGTATEIQELVQLYTYDYQVERDSHTRCERAGRDIFGR